MKSSRATNRWATRVAILGIALLGPLSIRAADSLRWSKEKDSVDADISSWSLVRTLETISEATGWQVYLEPGTRKAVSTKFKERSKDRALDMLLGNLGRALLPGTNGGPPRLLVFRNKERDATRLIRARSKRGKPIPDELIVRVKKGKSVDDVAAGLGAKVLGKSDELNAGRLKFDNEEAAAKARETLLENPDVESADPNFPVMDQPTLDSSAAASAGNLNLKPLKDGDPLIVGLIDTGVQTTGGAYDDFLLPGISVSASQTAANATEPSHGTSMFEVLLKSIDAFSADGSTTPVKVLPVDVFGSGKATTFEVAEGIAQALKGGARIINLSLGSEGDTPILHEVIRQGTAAGAVFVASAGNTPTDAPTFPAGYPEVFSVTAGDSPTTLAPYANFSEVNDAMAPGTARIQYGGNTWIVNGTSPAAAYFSGAVAVGVSSGQTAAQAAQAAQRTFPLPASARRAAP